MFCMNMIPGFEKVNIPYYVQSEVKKEEPHPTEHKNKPAALSQSVKLTGALAGLAILGYAGVRAFKGKGLKTPAIQTTDIKPQVIKIFQETLPEETLTRYRDWFNQIKDFPAHIWEGGKTVSNPQAENLLRPLSFNLPETDKKAFIQEYCKMTGFPYIDRINENMHQEILTQLDNMVQGTGNRVLFAAYDSNCSIGRGKAFPGSDCDGLFVVVENGLSEKVNRFAFGNSINQRLLDTTGEHYPEVYPLEELLKYIDKVDEIFPNFATAEKIAEYENNILYDGKSYLKAGLFNIDLSEQLSSIEEKNMICEAGFFVEMLRGGKVLINTLPESVLKTIKKSSMYKYSNMTRQEGLRNKTKPKLENREELCRRFMEMNVDEKFEVCCDLLKNSCGIKPETGAKDAFENFDMGDILDMYRKISGFFDIQK